MGLVGVEGEGRWGGGGGELRALALLQVGLEKDADVNAGTLADAVGGLCGAVVRLWWLVVCE